MTETDNRFFEAYKRLDRLCGDILSVQNGVSEYILQMECSTDGCYRISSWQEDYKTLKHLRWVRNQIAHDTIGCTVSTAEDIRDVIGFHNRIMGQTDPFSQLRKVKNFEKKSPEIQPQHTTVRNVTRPIADDRTPPYNDKRSNILRTLAWIVFAILLADIVLYLKISHII